MARFTRAICCLVKFARPVKRQTSIEHHWMARVKRAMTECDDRFNEASFVRCHRHPSGEPPAISFQLPSADFL